MAWGPGQEKRTHLLISLQVLSSFSSVSKNPGVSTIRSFLPFQSVNAFWQLLVRDWALIPDLKSSFPRIVFAVALFPLPVFPTRTTLIAFFWKSSMSLWRCLFVSSGTYVQTEKKGAKKGQTKWVENIPILLFYLIWLNACNILYTDSSQWKLKDNTIQFP